MSIGGSLIASPSAETEDMLWQDWLFAAGALSLVVAVVLGFLWG
jgi:hypothetical protein